MSIYVTTKNLEEIPKEQIPSDAQKFGAMLMTKSPEGQPIAMRVHEVKDKTIVVDLNHPLGGKTLTIRRQSHRHQIAETK